VLLTSAVEGISVLHSSHALFALVVATAVVALSPATGFLAPTALADEGGGGHGGGGGDHSGPGGGDDRGPGGGPADYGGPGSWGSSSSTDARNAVTRGWVVPLGSVLATVKRSVPGKVLEVDLQQSTGGLWFYKFLVLTRDGRYREIFVDARRNQILRVRTR
jgi:hypothetical protein